MNLELFGYLFDMDSIFAHSNNLKTQQRIKLGF